MMSWWRKGPAYWRSVRAARSSPTPSQSPLVSRPPLMNLGGVSQSLGQARGSLFLFNLTGSWTPRFARKRSRSSTWPVKRLLVQFRLTRALPNCGSRQLFHGLQRLSLGVFRPSGRCLRQPIGRGAGSSRRRFQKTTFGSPFLQTEMILLLSSVVEMQGASVASLRRAVHRRQHGRSASNRGERAERPTANLTGTVTARRAMIA
jgi:hypothetical protein